MSSAMKSRASELAVVEVGKARCPRYCAVQAREHRFLRSQGYPIAAMSPFNFTAGFPFCTKTKSSSRDVLLSCCQLNSARRASTVKGIPRCEFGQASFLENQTIILLGRGDCCGQSLKIQFLRSRPQIAQKICLQLPFNIQLTERPFYWTFRALGLSRLLHLHSRK